MLDHAPVSGVEPGSAGRGDAAGGVDVGAPPRLAVVAFDDAAFLPAAPAAAVPVRRAGGDADEGRALDRFGVDSPAAAFASAVFLLVRSVADAARSRRRMRVSSASTSAFVATPAAASCAVTSRWTRSRTRSPFR
jgi:hypothetical protein